MKRIAVLLGLRVDRFGLRPTLATAAFAGLGLSVAGNAGAAVGGNTAHTFKGGTSLAATGNWTGGIPGVSNDAEFVSTYPTSGTLVGVLSNSSPNYGSLDDLNTVAIITIGDNNASAASVITLGGTGNLGNSVAPDPGDLLFVGAGSTMSIVPTQLSSASAFLSINLGQIGNVDVAGSLNVGSVISSNGAYGLTKTGGGVLTLSGTNTYTGTTTVSAGELRINTTSGSGTGAGPVMINSGATLGGKSSIGNGISSIVVNGTITAGLDDNTTGTLVTGPQTWNAGGTKSPATTPARSPGTTCCRCRGSPSPRAARPDRSSLSRSTRSAGAASVEVRRSCWRPTPKRR